MENENSAPPQNAPAFLLRDCALVVQATGVSAQTLRELVAGLREVDAGCIYHHFWGRLLQPQFDEPEYNNDFASWCHRALHDKQLAEQLSVVDPAECTGIEELRETLIDIIEEHLAGNTLPAFAQADQQFYFLTSQIVVFDTGIALSSPRELLAVAPQLSPSSVFYHFVDARRRRSDAANDFSAWLANFGEEFAMLRQQLDGLDPYFSSLGHLRDLLAVRVAELFEKEAV